MRHKIRQILKNFEEKVTKTKRKKRRNELELRKLEQLTLNKLGMIDVPKFLLYYQVFSTSVHVLNLLAFIFFKAFGEQLTVFNIQISCYIGKFTLDDDSRKRYMTWMGGVLSALHLSWRYLIYQTGRSARLDLIPFLMSPSTQVKAAIEDSYANNSDWPAAGEDANRNNMEDDELLAGAIANRILRKTIAIEFMSQESNRFSSRTQFLRPNRTLDSYLKRRCDVHSIITIAIYAALVSSAIFVPIALNTLIFKQHVNYPTCPENQLDLKSPIWLYRCLSSTLLSLIIAIDSIGSLLMPSSFVVLLVSDVNLHWSEIRQELVLTYEALLKICQQNLDFNYTLCGERKWSPTRRASSLNYQVVSVFQQVPHSSRILRLQESCADFFICLRQVDANISLFLTFVLVVWLVLNAAITFLGFQLDTGTGIFMRLFQVFGLALILSVGNAILRLRRSAEPSYKIMHALAAIDRSPNQFRWLKILENFSPMKRYAFTLSNGAPLTEMTLLKILSHTFTFVVVFDNIWSYTVYGSLTARHKGG